MSFTPDYGRRTPLHASRLNKGSDFYDDMGQLSDDYSYEGGAGMVAMGEGLVGATRGAGRDGMVGGTETRTIYGKLPEQSAPQQATELPEAVAEEAELPPSDIQLSGRAARANAATQAYEKHLLNKQGDVTIRGDSSPVQDYKDAYQNNLTEELKTKAPTTLANKRAEIELADKQKADMNDSYELNLGQY